MRRKGLLPVLSAAIIFLCSACSSTRVEPVLTARPADFDWALATASDARLSKRHLSELTKALRSNEIANVHAVLIEYDGRLVYEEYFSGTDERWDEPRGVITFDRNSLHDVRSITKSVTTLLLGIALGDQFRTKLQRSLVSYFPDRADAFGKAVERITLEDALTMRAGLQWKEQGVPFSQNDELRMYDTADPVAMVLARPVVDVPGVTWNYNGGLTQLLAEVIQRETGSQIDRFAEQKLFEPLGIQTYEWRSPPLWGNDQSPSAPSGLRLRARDLAKIGSLMLNGGKWRGRQIVPSEWIDLSIERRVASVPFFPDDTFGYGFMWYPGKVGGHRVVAAIGNGEQLLFILPDDKVAITVLAGNYNDWNSDRPLAVLKRVIAAVDSDSSIIQR